MSAAETTERRAGQPDNPAATLAEALASLLRTVVVALFLLTFLLQPYLIPSESMERTLLVGDFLLVDKLVFAPDGALSRLFLPYREPQRGDVVVFHRPQPEFLVKRIVALPGDRVHVAGGRAVVNGQPQAEPYACFEPAAAIPSRDDFPVHGVPDPETDPLWTARLRMLTRGGELIVPPGEYFVLGDNRNHSRDSRFWGLVPRAAIVARPLLVYFSLKRPSATDRAEPLARASDDRLGHDGSLIGRAKNFARWGRLFAPIH